MDLNMWLSFINNQSIFCRPFIDCDKTWYADELLFYTDATANPELGMGAICMNQFMYQKWDANFINN